jgi:dTDP-4-amino-4,6-dideoxygalactose transaminase
MRVPLADLQAQHKELRPELNKAFDEVMESCQFILGQNVTAFEKEMAEISGSKFGLGVNSGTDALLLSILALGIGAGDEVITTPFTFVATAETICLAGATPVFADIDRVTFNLDPDSVRSKITEKTKAIMPVHLFGQTADMAAYENIAAEYNIPIIADGAQAIGAAYLGKPIGKLAKLSTLSFFPTKNLGACGDAGLILTDDEYLAEQIRLLRFHGSGGGYIYKKIGYCTRLDELQAAFLRVKLRYLTQWNDARRANAASYLEGLSDLGDHIALPAEVKGAYHVYHQYTLRVLHGRRNELMEYLKEHGIGCAVYYPLSLHLQEAYNALGYEDNDLPVSEQTCREVLSIPVHQGLENDQIHFTIDKIRSFFA